MKRILCPLIILLSSHFCFSQSQTPSTIGQVYNFDVGDTFVYSVNYGEYSSAPYPCFYNWLGYFEIVITGKRTSSDTALYYFAKKENETYVTPHPPPDCYGGSGQPFPWFIQQGHVRLDTSLLFTNTDSSIFDIYIIGCDSINNCFSSVFSDSLYYGRKENRQRYYTSDETFVDGLGAVSVSDGAEGEPSNSNSSQLIYYHKVSGEIWGTSSIVDTFYTGVSNLQNELTQLKVFPNPTTNEITIDYGAINWGNQKEISLVLVNTLGKVIYSQPVKGYSSYQKIDVSRFAAGLYMVYFKNDEQILVVQRFAKE